MTYTARELEAMGRSVTPEAVELRRWRRERCISQKELSKRLGVGASEVGRFEVGILRPNKDGSPRVPKRWPELLARLYATWTPADLSVRARVRLANRLRARGIDDPRQLWIAKPENGDQP